jgi:phage protein D
MARSSDLGVAAFDVKVGGASVDPSVLAAVAEISVDARLRVPDQLTMRLRDDQGSIIAAGTFAVGTAIKITLGSDDDTDEASVFDGQVSALAPRFDPTSVMLTVIALDRGCLLQRAPVTASYQEMSYGAIAAKLARAAGLRAGTIDSGLTLPFVQQSNETEWAFLWRLALDVDYELKVTGDELHFRAAGGPAGSSPVTLKLGEELRSFSPRVSAVQQIGRVEVRGWDPTAAKAVSATAQPPAKTDSAPGISRESVAGALGEGSVVVVDHPLLDQQHATTVARSVAAHIANAYIEGEGTADGDPDLKPGARVELEGVGKAFGGTYALSGVRHVLSPQGSFETRFYICGREDRSLLGLAEARSEGGSGWGRRIVVGVVTNNDDPEKRARVRVRYPTLSDDHEGWWARVVAPGAGGARGLLSLPEVGDEVLVVFEHESEQHPYVLGSVFNGRGMPGALSTTDGSFGLFSDRQLIVTAVDKIDMTAGTSMKLAAAGDAVLTTHSGTGGGAAGDITISSKGRLAMTADQDVAVKASATVGVTSNAGMKLAAGSTLEISGQGQVTITGASIRLQAASIVQVSAPRVKLG